MNSLEVDFILKSIKSTKDIFYGVFACDDLPSKIRRMPAILVCNTQPSHKPGEHWIVIYISKKGCGEYFDSFGLPPQNKFFINFLNKNCVNYKYKKIMIQSIFSNFCGQFCIIYSYFKSLNKSLKTFLKMFNSKNLYANNSIIVNFFYKNICSYKIKQHCLKLFQK